MSEEKKTAAAPEVCVVCRRPLGADRVPTPDGEGSLCRPCSYRDALRGVDERAAENQAIMESVEPVKEGPGKVRRFIGLLALMAVVGGTMASWEPIVSKAMETDSQYALGPSGSTTQAVEKCLAALWEIRAAMDVYRGTHDGAIPRRLGALKGIEENCPATGKPWIYERGEGGKYLIACPEPGKLGRGAIFLSHLYGPPRVRLSGEVSLGD